MAGLSKILHQVPLIFAVPLLAPFAWRLWRFTVVPFLYPNEPKLLPSGYLVCGLLLQAELGEN